MSELWRLHAVSEVLTAACSLSFVTDDTIIALQCMAHTMGNRISDIRICFGISSCNTAGDVGLLSNG